MINCDWYLRPYLANKVSSYPSQHHLPQVGITQVGVSLFLAALGGGH